MHRRDKRAATLGRAYRRRQLDVRIKAIGKRRATRINCGLGTQIVIDTRGAEIGLLKLGFQLDELGRVAARPTVRSALLAHLSAALL